MLAIRPGGASIHVVGAGIQVIQPMAGSSLDADAAALIAAMSVAPDSTRQTLISDTITALKAAGVWAELDELWMLAAHDAQAARLGWKRYRDLTAVNSPTFTTDRGYAGNGTTSYLDTGYVPSTDGVQYTKDDASFGVYSRTSSTSSVCDIGARDGANVATSQLFIRNTGPVVNLAANQGATASLSHAVASTGLWVGRRTASNAIQAFRNGVSVVTATNASTTLTARAMFICARNDAGTPGGFSTRQYAFAFVGASLTDQQQLDLFTITEAFLDALGAGVI